MTIWTPETVLARLIEAAEVIAITTRRDGHKRLRTLWPEWQRDYAGKMRKPRRTASPAEVARAEEAITWYELIEDQESRCALQFQVLSAATGVSFSKVCNKFGWKRTTVISRNSIELKRLSEKLCLDRVPMQDPDPRHLRQKGAKPAPINGTLEKCATHWRNFEPGKFDPENFDPAWAKAQAEKRRRKLLGAEVEEEEGTG